MREQDRARLRVARAGSHPPGVEPLAAVVREAMDAAGLSQSDVERITELDRRHISQIVNRAKNYTRPPTIDTMQALARIPGLSIETVADAVFRSTGQPRPSVAIDGASMTPLRRSVHAVVDKIPEDDLTRALQILIALLG